MAVVEIPSWQFALGVIGVVAVTIASVLKNENGTAGGKIVLMEKTYDIGLNGTSAIFLFGTALLAACAMYNTHSGSVFDKEARVNTVMTLGVMAVIYYFSIYKAGESNYKPEDNKKMIAGGLGVILLLKVFWMLNDGGFDNFNFAGFFGTLLSLIVIAVGFYMQFGVGSSAKKEDMSTARIGVILIVSGLFVWNLSQSMM